MKLSTRSRYGLKALYDLAINQNGPVSIKAIAMRQGISDAYLEQLFASLKKAGIIKSSRGAQGGYELSRDARDISIGEILSALEGSTSIADCVGEAGCENVCSCPSHPVFVKIQEAIDAALNGMSLQTMIEQNEERPTTDGSYHR